MAPRLSAEDFETASIRSAAPSYVSDAPSYHSTLPPTEALPQYTPPARTGNSTPTNASSRPPMVPPANGSSLLYGPGLPPIHDLPPRSRAPQMTDFRIPTWSTMHSNPTARHYQAVANRRATRGSSSNSSSRGGGSAALNGANSEQQVQGALRAVLGRLNEQEDERERTRSRPLEDPYLVGEEAAARARRERLARESGDDILIREDQRWDWFLGQIQDWDQRRESWRQFEQSRRSRRRW